MQDLDRRPDLNGLFDAIQNSHAIKKHVDFFVWLQNDICPFIPHDVLIASWGDFSNRKIDSDVSSCIPDIHTQQVAQGHNDIEPLMQALFKKWEENGDRWYFFEEFDESGLSAESSETDSMLGKLQKMKSVLVYGYRDKRGENDILYAFFRGCERAETQTSVLSMIMPHIDAALRSIECLTPPKKAVGDAVSSISERECEVMNLVLQGKTNTEIGEVLFISLNTVKNHLKAIYRKMEVSSRAEAVARYMVDADHEKDGSELTSCGWLETH